MHWMLAQLLDIDWGCLGNWSTFTWMGLSCFDFLFSVDLLDPTRPFFSRSMIRSTAVDLWTKVYLRWIVIPVNTSTNYPLGFMGPEDLSTLVWIYDPMGFRIQIHGIRSWDPFFLSTSMSSASLLWSFFLRILAGNSGATFLQGNITSTPHRAPVPLQWQQTRSFTATLARLPAYCRHIA